MRTEVDVVTEIRLVLSLEEVKELQFILDQGVNWGEWPKAAGFYIALEEAREEVRG